VTPEQFEARRDGIGGSEIAAILGLDPFSGPLDVWLAKVEGYQKPTTEDMERGQFLEAGIADWYAQREQLGAGNLQPGLRLDHGSLPHVFATPDRISFTALSTAPTQRPRTRLVSIKAPRRAGDSWGETGGSHVPVGYVLQLQWEAAVVRSLPSMPYDWESTMHLVALIDGDLRVYPVETDLELQAQLLDYAAKW